MTSITYAQALDIPNGSSPERLAVTTVTIPNNITSLKKDCLKNFENLRYANIPNLVTHLNDGCFSHTSSMTTLSLPASIQHIGKKAFEHSGLVSITIPPSVTHLGKSNDQRFHSVVSYFNEI